MDTTKSTDKILIALAIRNETYESNLRCSLLESSILESCSSCTLKLICDEIDATVAKYAKQTTSIVNSFSFN